MCRCRIYSCRSRVEACCTDNSRAPGQSSREDGVCRSGGPVPGASRLYCSVKEPFGGLGVAVVVKGISCSRTCAQLFDLKFRRCVERGYLFGAGIPHCSSAQHQRTQRYRCCGGCGVSVGRTARCFQLCCLEERRCFCQHLCWIPHLCRGTSRQGTSSSTALLYAVLCLLPLYYSVRQGASSPCLHCVLNIV